jgi:hypothetical protein
MIDVAYGENDSQDDGSDVRAVNATVDGFGGVECGEEDEPCAGKRPQPFSSAPGLADTSKRPIRNELGVRDECTRKFQSADLHLSELHFACYTCPVGAADDALFSFHLSLLSLD